MSYSSYLTKVSLTGSKAKFILTDEEGHESSLRMLFHDFLDMECIKDPTMKYRKDAFLEEFGKVDTDMEKKPGDDSELPF